MTPLQIHRYLARIGLDGRPPGPPEAQLAALQRAHLWHIPFENLDIHLNRPIQLNVDRILEKILQGRGGFCYELNGAFAALLEGLGFTVHRLEARVGPADGPQTPFDHLCLRVSLNEAWLVDVGFGACFAEPLPVKLGVNLVDPNGTYRFEASTSEDRISLFEDGKLQYRFGSTPYSLSDFEPGCTHHQTSPASHFTQNPVISKPTARGRITLRGNRLIETIAGKKTEHLIPESALLDAYREHFGVTLPYAPRS